MGQGRHLGVDRRKSPSLFQKASKHAYALRARAIGALDRLSRTANKSHFLLVDPGLIAFNGHHLEFTRLMKNFFSRDFAVTVYSHHGATNSVVASLMARPIFYDGPYVQYEEGKFDDVYASMTRSTAASLSKIPRRKLGSTSIVAMHTVTNVQLGGLAKWYAELPGRVRPKLFLQFQFPLEHSVYQADWPKAIAFAREAANALANSGQVRFACNSRPLAVRIADQIGQACAPMPLPTAWPARVRREDPGAVFGFFGGLRVEKGAELIAEAIPEFAKQYPDVHFIIQAPRIESDQALIRILERVPQVELIDKNFSTKEAYFASFCRAGCIMLPYDPSKYAIRTSGIFLEALGLGKLILTTSGTWMESELAPYRAAGIVMQHFSIQDLLDALERARQVLLAGNVQLSPKEKIMAEHSGPSFCLRLLEVVDRSATAVRAA